jgi:hypothetical protein
MLRFVAHVAAVATASTIVSAQQVVHELDIAVYAPIVSGVTNSVVDPILREMGGVLATPDSPADEACDVAFERPRAIVTFPTGDGSINSTDELNAVFAVRGQVKVVPFIYWCGGAIVALGCARIGGNSMIVSISMLEVGGGGVVWTHEFGHMAGLEHRNGSAFLMDEGFDASRRTINVRECERFREPL